jgi:hypothetical protein
MLGNTQRWLWGPATDLLLGCGLAYVAVFVAMLFVGREMQAWIPLGLLPLGSLLLGTPHYGATILRAYERREDRRRYWLFTVHATALIFAVFLGGLYVPLVGSIVYTIYLTWSPWHYAGQNFGLAAMFLRRRGVETSPSARRALHGSFVLSFVLTFLVIHDTVAAGSTYASKGAAPYGYEFIPLGLPASVSSFLTMAALLGYIACVVSAAMQLKRKASWADLAPTAALVGSQALWFLVPAVVQGLGVGQGLVPLALSDAEYASWWIIFAHSVQYLWVTSYYAAVETGSRPTGFLVRAFLAGSAVWGVPALVFATAHIGPIAYDQGLLVLIASCVNLHHFILDGAIWKLRDGPVARILLRGEGADEKTPSRPRGFRWSHQLVWALGAICAVQFTAYTLELEFGVRRATERGDTARLGKATQHFTWIGLETPNAPLNQGILYARQGQLREARKSLQRSLDLYPTSLAYTALGQVRARAGDLSASLTSLESALELDPQNTTALHQMGVTLLKLDRPDEAVKALSRARSAAAGQPEIQEIDRMLERARREADETG